MPWFFVIFKRFIRDINIANSGSVINVKNSATLSFIKLSFIIIRKSYNFFTIVFR